MDQTVADRAFIEAIAIAYRAGVKIKQLAGDSHHVQIKQGLDIVTEADTQSEALIISHLKGHFPDHVFSSEELATKQADVTAGIWRWVIDPLDGTINYANHIPFSAVSMALQYNGDTILGVVYDLTFGAMYAARKGQGAYKYEAYQGPDSQCVKILVSPEQKLDNSVITFLLTSHFTDGETDAALTVVKSLASKTRGLRLWVGQAAELAFLAEGQLQGTVGTKPRGFSAAAGVLLVREAGGIVTDLSGTEFGNSSTSILATNGSIHRSVLALLAP